MRRATSHGKRGPGSKKAAVERREASASSPDARPLGGRASQACLPARICLDAPLGAPPPSLGRGEREGGEARPPVPPGRRSVGYFAVCQSKSRSLRVCRMATIKH